MGLWAVCGMSTRKSIQTQTCYSMVIPALPLSWLQGSEKIFRSIAYPTSPFDVTWPKRAVAMLLCTVCPTYVKTSNEASPTVFSLVVNARRAVPQLLLLFRGQNYLLERLTWASSVLCHGQAPGVGGRSVHKRQTQSIAGPNPVSTKVNKTTVYLRLLLKNHWKSFMNFLP